jgi:hypothetical protein
MKRTGRKLSKKRTSKKLSMNVSMKRTGKSKKGISKKVNMKVILYLESFSWTLKTLSMMKSKCRQPGPFPQEQV